MINFIKRIFWSDSRLLKEIAKNIADEKRKHKLSDDGILRIRPSWWPGG